MTAPVDEPAGMPSIRTIAVGLPVKQGHVLALGGTDHSRGLDWGP